MPMLNAYEVLPDWHCSINFRTYALSISNQHLSLQKANAGHIFVKSECIHGQRRKSIGRMMRTADTTAKRTDTVHRMGVVDVAEVNETRIAKLHHQLGRACAETMCRLFRQAGYLGLEILIRKCVTDCGCEKERAAAPRSIAKTHVPTRRGEVIGMDIMYPIDGCGRSRPYLIIVDHLSRSTVTCRMNSHKPEHAIDLFYKMWLRQIGRPGEILPDRGPAFIGAEWGSMCDLMEIQTILIARECPRENGIAERSVGVVKNHIPYSQTSMRGSIG